MSNSSKPNIGAVMVLIHHAITRGLEVSRKQSIAFELSGFPDQAIKEGFVTYVRTLGWVINAHHQAEDHVIYPYLKSKLPDAPYDQLSAEHREMDIFLNELQATIEEVATKAQTSDLLNSLNRSLTGLIELWAPHIQKEQFYLYDTEKTEAVMDEDEQIKLIQDASEYSQKQGDPSFMMPFILYNLEPEERANMSQNMPPVLIQELVPIAWKKQWSPMQPFLLN
ncbi:MAG: hemerythrin domain-containing protein [Actinobacteria bacterium]|nr:hemerythrin domain-containing protein [Actinomycetota bacterium]